MGLAKFVLIFAAVVIGLVGSGPVRAAEPIAKCYIETGRDISKWKAKLTRSLTAKLNSMNEVERKRALDALEGGPIPTRSAEEQKRHFIKLLSDVGLPDNQITELVSNIPPLPFGACCSSCKDGNCTGCHEQSIPEWIWGCGGLSPHEANCELVAGNEVQCYPDP